MTSETPKSNAELAREICPAPRHERDVFTSGDHPICRCAAITKALDDAEERGALKAEGYEGGPNKRTYKGGAYEFLSFCIVCGAWENDGHEPTCTKLVAAQERGRQDGLAVAAAFLDEKGLTVLAQHMRSLNAT